MVKFLLNGVNHTLRKKLCKNYTNFNKNYYTVGSNFVDSLSMKKIENNNATKDITITKYYKEGVGKKIYQVELVFIAIVDGVQFSMNLDYLRISI